MNTNNEDAGGKRNESDEYTVRRYRSGDREGFLSLFEDVFGFAQSPAWFAWKYERNPYVDHVPIIVAERDGELVGARPLMAFEMSVGRERHTALQPSDTMVHPDHRRRGLFTRMTERAIEKYEREEPAFFFNFPNEKSGAGYLKLGWRKIGEQTTYYRIADPARVVASEAENRGLNSVKGVAALLGKGISLVQDSLAPKPSDLSVRREAEIPSETLASLYAESAPSAIHAVRDERFYDWRFENPNWEYSSYLVEGVSGPALGAIVGTSTGGGMTKTALTDIAPLDADAKREAAIALVHRMISDHPDADMFAAPPHLLPKTTFGRLGFVADDTYPLSTFANPTVHVARSLSESWELNGLHIADPDNWRITFAEEDTS